MTAKPKRARPPVRRPAPAREATRVNLGGLARRWGVTKSRVRELVADPSFPPGEPIVGGGEKVELVYRLDETDRWRAATPAERRAMRWER